MNTKSTVEQLNELKLYGMAKLYGAVSEQPVHGQPDTHTLMGMLTEAELQYRVQQRTQLYLRLSKLRYHALVEQVDTTAGRGVSKEMLVQLCDGSFIERSENLLITGATGCGYAKLMVM